MSEEHNVDQMANNLIRLFDDVEYAKHLGAAAREDHIKNFSLERHIKSLEETLQKAMTKS